MDFIKNYLTNYKSKLTKEICVLGIDLGTTNSTAAEVNWAPGSTPACKILEIDQPTREGLFTSPLVPSVVAIPPGKELWVGEGPKRLRAFLQESNLSFEKNLFYDTKNEMGLRKTYFRAPESFNHASKIAGHILAFLKEGAEKATGKKYEHISVTVPASFELNQRRDTLLACKYAGLDMRDDDLLDEPTAALIYYMHTTDLKKVLEKGSSIRCVVFDFGGGTCDVSVVEIATDKAMKKITMSQLSVSRYHRLGGGDVDAAIVHEHLIPMLLEENNLSPLDLTWAQKKRGLEPQLLGKAEALKIALCKEVERLKKFGKYDESDKTKIVTKQPPLTCKLGKDQFSLSKPSLSAADFEELLKPFIDRDFLYAKETEFRLTQSVFTPLQDALARAGKEQHEIDFCLMVGGSSLIPQVRDAVEQYFHKAVVGHFKDHLDTQIAVAQGAAWNAVIKALTKRPLIEPVLHDGIALITAKGKLNPLVPSKITLPFPEDGSYAREKLYVPKGELPGNELRFEVVGEEERQLIFNEVWTLPDNVSSGDEVTMEYRVTSGKQFECRAYLTEFPESVFEKSVENPLVNVLNPNEIRVKIEKAEEELRQKGGGRADDQKIFITLAEWYAELGQQEKALDYLRTALSRLQRPDFYIIFLQGNYFSELRDYERAEKAYREADRLTASYLALFNLALDFFDRKLYKEALETVEEATEKAGNTGLLLSLKSLCEQGQGDSVEAEKTLSEAMRIYNPPESLEKWEFAWYYSSAKRLGDDKYIKKAKSALKKRRNKGEDISEDEIPRPAMESDSDKKA